MIYPTEIEKSTAVKWMMSGTIRLIHEGNENWYFIDTFGLTYMAKYH